MDRQRLIVLIVSLVVLIGVIAGVNYRYLQPKVLSTMPKVEKVKVPEKIQSPFKSDPYAGTMEQILADKEEQGLVSAAMEIIKRNPFSWPGEFVAATLTPEDPQQTIPGHAAVNSGPKMTSSGDLKKTPPVIPPVFNLSMVIVGEKSNLALVNNIFVTVGSSISGYDVVKIEPRTVFLASKDDQKRLTLEPGVPLQKIGDLKQKNNPQQKVPPAEQSEFLDFKTQLKQVIDFSLNPNIHLK